MEYQLGRGYAIRHIRLGSLPNADRKTFVDARLKFLRKCRAEYGYFECAFIPEVGDLHGALHHHMLVASSRYRRIEQTWISDTWGELTNAPVVWVNAVATPDDRDNLPDTAGYFAGYLVKNPAGRLQLTRHALPRHSTIDYHTIKRLYGLPLENAWGRTQYRTTPDVINAWRSYLASGQPFYCWLKSYNSLTGGQYSLC